MPWPGDLDAARLGTGAKALDDPACAAYRAAWEAYRAACADHHGRAALVLIDGLLDRFGGAFEEAKAARAAIDFSDLELRVRDLLTDPAARRSWAERFDLIMVDEFQDTNRLQLDVLEALERDNLFAVGDEFQSIYRFRHADVTIFRERRDRLGADRVRRLERNFRSREDLLDVLNAAFAPELGERFAPLVAGREEPLPPALPDSEAPLRLFDPDPGGSEPAVELLITDTRGWDEPELERALGLTALAPQPWRRAEARLVAHRLRAEIDGGRRPGDVVVLVRATASLRLLEQALEEQGLPTYVVGGRGYWSQEQVRDGIAYLGALANPLDEEALLATLASPFCGLGTDALVLLTQAGRESGRGAYAALTDADHWTAPLEDGQRARVHAFARFFAAERARAERVPAEVLLERAIVATGYDLAVLARSGGERRLANLRKLMRLAREYERAEGPDLRGFLAFAATQDLIEAREGEAALESDGLDAVRLMTIHRAKGLEFPVVCVADLGRAAGGNRERLLLGSDGSVGLKLSPIGGGEPVPALDWDRLAAREQEADAEEERRLFYVAMTRACERLILSGGLDCERLPRAAARRPADRLDRARADRRPGRRRRRAGDRDRAAVGQAAARACCAASTPPRRSEPCCRAPPCHRPPVHAPERPAPRCRTHPPSCPHLRPARTHPRSACPTAPSAPTPAAATASTSNACWGCRACRRRPKRSGGRRRSWDRTRSWRRRPGSMRAFGARSSTGCSRTSTSRGRSCPTARRCWRWRPPGASRSPPTRSRTSGRWSPRSPARRCASGSRPPAARAARRRSRSRSTRPATARSSTGSWTSSPSSTTVAC